MGQQPVVQQSIFDFRASIRHGGKSVGMDDDDMGRGVPKYAAGTDGVSMFFLQVLEHLILSSLRLYHAWKQVEYLHHIHDE